MMMRDFNSSHTTVILQWAGPVTPAEIHQELVATPGFIIEVLLLGYRAVCVFLVDSVLVP